MSDVLLQRDGHVATITLNRPDRLNAISGAMIADWAACWRSATATGTCGSSS